MGSPTVPGVTGNYLEKKEYSEVKMRIEKNNFAFGLSILGGDTVKFAVCKGECPDDCKYHLVPMTIKSRKTRKQNIIK
jgi:hypothetical protein